MNKIRILFFLFTAAIISSCGDIADIALENSLAGTDVYAAGYSTNSSGVKVAGYWKNGTWNKLTNTYGNYDAEVRSIVVSGYDVYAGGYSSDGTVNYAGYWKNGTWKGWTNTLDSNQSAEVNSIAVSGSVVYAGGYSCIGTGQQDPCYWTGTDPLSNPQIFPAVDTTKNSAVNSLVLSGSVLYAAGYSINSSNIKIPVCWNNIVSYNPLTPVLSTSDAEVLSIAVSGSDVYAGGYKVNPYYGSQVPGYRKNGTWISLPRLDLSQHSQVNSLFLVVTL